MSNSQYGAEQNLRQMMNAHYHPTSTTSSSAL
ncbi:hypothetical protein CCACVL1_28166, partial [Corchorus capsularis]